jgi:hypothetical protein
LLLEIPDLHKCSTSFFILAIITRLLIIFNSLSPPKTDHPCLYRKSRTRIISSSIISDSTSSRIIPSITSLINTNWASLIPRGISSIIIPNSKRIPTPAKAASAAQVFSVEPASLVEGTALKAAIEPTSFP